MIQLFRPSMRSHARSICAELLMRTRRVAGVMRGIQLERGQAHYGEERLSEVCGTTRQTTRTCISTLKKAGILTIKSTNHGSLLTWSDYNTLSGITEENQPTEQPASNQPITSHQPHKRGTETEQTGTESTKYLDLMADSWQEMDPGKPPYALFNSWKKSWGEEIPLETVQVMAAKGMTASKEQPLIGYAVTVCQNKAKERAEEEANRPVPIARETPKGIPCEKCGEPVITATPGFAAYHPQCEPSG